MSGMPCTSSITEPHSFTDHLGLESFFPPLNLYFIPLVRYLHVAHICDSINAGHGYLHRDVLPPFFSISLSMWETASYISVYLGPFKTVISKYLLNLMCIPWMSLENSGMWPLLYIVGCQFRVPKQTYKPSGKVEKESKRACQQCQLTRFYYHK